MMLYEPENGFPTYQISVMTNRFTGHERLSFSVTFAHFPTKKETIDAILEQEKLARDCEGSILRQHKKVRDHHKKQLKKAIAVVKSFSKRRWSEFEIDPKRNISRIMSFVDGKGDGGVAVSLRWVKR
jgi:hypothetical protein